MRKIAKAAELAQSQEFVLREDGTAQAQTFGDYTSNIPLITLGIAEVREGNAIVQGGLAHIAEGIIASWITPLAWSYGKDDHEVKGCTALGQMFVPRHHPDGKVDAKFVPAMYQAIADNFDIEGGMTTADKQAFRRAFAIAAAHIAGIDVQFVFTDAPFKGRMMQVRAVDVPASIAYDLTKEDGSLSDAAREMVDRIKGNAEVLGQPIPSDEEAFAGVSAMRVKCIGGRHAVLGKVPSSTDIANRLAVHAIAAGHLPPAKQRAGSTVDAGAEFVKSADFMISCLKLILDPASDESKFAPSEANDAKLAELEVLLAEYFTRPE